jgi:hypothetical protein
MQHNKLRLPHFHGRRGISNILTMGTHRVHIKTDVWI